MLIQNGVVHPMDGPVIPNGYVLLEGNKIKAVGSMDAVPQGWAGPVLDAAGGHILPGLVDAHCHLGMCGDGLGFEAEDDNESTDPCTPHLRALDGLNPLDRCFREAREAGVTTVLTGPGSGNPINGQGLAVKTIGRWAEEMVVLEPASLKLALGENPKTVYHERKETPMTRMGTAAIIRAQFSKALEYLDKQNKADAEEDTDPPDFDPKLEALLPALRGEVPVHIHAHRADDIATAVRLAREFGLKLVVVHGTEAHLLPELLAREHIPVITGPILTDRSKPELANSTSANPALLAKDGVEIAICTDHPVIPIQHLTLCAAVAARSGLEPEEALKAITLNGARLAGVDHRVGSLTPGKDADVVVTSGHPLDWMSRVEHVFIDGVQVK
ncbi:amidohydrolase [Intestinimonas butyriciproducens]|uniref:amidohydrolase n=1 Tax=Intestinimonas butyriciproducens TaxID=1297617 RepID=UPI00195A891B|nr:amidohydrolase [Intestinimonas butyriciproducens]MBM6976270.1 amidohydrolase [Intestinimonas butyriciproducens]